MEQDSDDGFGLVEIVVAMLVLAALSLALLPLLVQGLQLSARNATTASAVQQVNEALQNAQSWSPDCEALVDAFDDGPETYTDARDVDIVITTTVQPCPVAASDSLVVEVHSAAVRSDEGTTLAEATTLVFVNRVTP